MGKMVPGAGLEPARPFKVPRDFKSLVSTNFTIRATRIEFYVSSRPRKSEHDKRDYVPRQTSDSSVRPTNSTIRATRVEFYVRWTRRDDVGDIRDSVRSRNSKASWFIMKRIHGGDWRRESE